MKKKLLLMAMLVIAMVCLLAVTTAAANKIGTVAVDGLNYTVYDDMTASLKDNRQSTKTEIVIPTTVTYNDKEYTVTATENYALHNSDSLTSIYFPPTIKVLGEHTFSSCASLSAVYIDLENLTSIGTCGLTDNTSTRDYGVKNDGVFFYATSEYGKETPVKTTDAVFTSLVAHGDGCMQGANFNSITLGENVTSVGVQSLRKAKITSLTVLGDITSIGSWSVAQCPNLETVSILSETVKTIGNYAFGSCTKIKSFTIGLSSCEKLEGSVFEFTGDCQSNNTNTTTIWTNPEGKRIVDLSSMKDIGSEAFGTSNVGSAEIIWPQALDSLSDQAFRKANITGLIYLNASKGKTLTVPRWAMDGNSFTTAIFGANVTTIDCYFTSQCTVVCLADSVAVKRSDTFKTNGSTLYCKSLDTTNGVAVSSNVTVVPITSGSAVWSRTCGIYATVQTADGAVKVGTDTHTFEFVDYNNNYCPINVMGDYYCEKCKTTKQEIAVKDYDGVAPKLGHDVSELENILYANGIINVGNTVMGCADCDHTVTTEGNANAIVEFKGFSAKIGGSEMIVSYDIDKEALANYKLVNADFKLGMAARILSEDGASDELVKVVDGVAQATSEKSIVAELTNDNVIYVMFKIKGFSLEQHYNLALAMCAFVYDDGEVDYICQNAEGVIGQYDVAYATTFNNEAKE